MPLRFNDEKDRALNPQRIVYGLRCTCGTVLFAGPCPGLSDSLSDMCTGNGMRSARSGIVGEGGNSGAITAQIARPMERGPTLLATIRRHTR